MKGVLDRIEDDMAVIIIEEVGREFTLAKEELPSGSKIGTWFAIDFSDDQYTILSIDKEKTEQAYEKSALLMKKLQQKKKRSKFKRS